MISLTHDDLYKKYLRNSYGPNVFPLVKTITILCAYFLIIILLLINMITVTNTKYIDSAKIMPVETVPEPLESPIVSINKQK